MLGDIIGMQMTDIYFSYCPMSFSTAEMEIQIKTTEFDSQPKTIRIVGTSAPYTGPPIDINSKGEGDHNQSKTLLQSTKQFNAQTRLQKLKGGGHTTDDLTDTKAGILNLKSVKLTPEETSFLM